MYVACINCDPSKNTADLYELTVMGVYL